MTLTAKEQFSLSLSLIRKHYGWSYADLGVLLGRTRQWAFKLETGLREGTHMGALDLLIEALAKAEPPLHVTASELMDPEQIRAKLGIALTRPVTQASNTPALKGLADGATLRTQVDRLEREHAKTVSVLFDLHTSLRRHFGAADSSDVRRTPPPAAKASRSSRKPR